jgi:hypothetical protein
MLKKGYYYKFIGELEIWWDKDMKKILNKEWYKCVEVDGIYVRFEGIEDRWYWYCEDFVESKYPPKDKVIKLLKEYNV